MCPGVLSTSHPEGFTAIDDGLLDALIGYPLSKRQYKVVLGVIRKTFGFGKQEDDISSAHLAELTGLDSSHCRATVRELAALGVLQVRAGHFGQWMRINPQPATWRQPMDVAAEANIGSERLEEPGRNSPEPRAGPPEDRTQTAPGAGQNGPHRGPNEPIARAETAQGKGQISPDGRAKTARNKRQPPIDKSKSLSSPNPSTGGQVDPPACPPPDEPATGLPERAEPERAATDPATDSPDMGQVLPRGLALECLGAFGPDDATLVAGEPQATAAGAPTPRRTARAKPPTPELPPLPLNIPPDLWAEFIEHRRAMRSPMTPIAQRRALILLERMAETGQDPAAVLEQSIVQGWKGLFPVRGIAPAQPVGGVGFQAQRIARTAQSLQQIFGETDAENDLSAGDELPGGRLRHGADSGASSGVLGPARWAAR